jgi:Holliday junction resolvase RusA-like endonuclease
MLAKASVKAVEADSKTGGGDADRPSSREPVEVFRCVITEAEGSQFLKARKGKRQNSKYRPWARAQVKKNSKSVISVNGRLIPLSDKEYTEWEKRIAELFYAKKLPGAAFEGDVNLAAVFEMTGNYPGDLSNLLEGIQDALQSAGVIANDRQIVSLDGTELFRNAEENRIEVELFGVNDNGTLSQG